MQKISVFGCAVTVALAAAFVGPARSQEAEKSKTVPDPAQQKTGGRRGMTPPLVSPEVHPDRRVTFRLRAPEAKQVRVSGEWKGGSREMARDDSGVWSVTLGPLEAGLFGYGFTVDGFSTLDPGNPAIKPMRSPRTSILEIPGDPPRLTEFQDVPHGTVRVHEYRSGSLGRRRGLVVYTPPGYDKDPAARYPVLFLFHGSGDNEATWTTFGKAHLIVDNLIAQGKATPMVVVMPDGHAAPPRPPGAAPTERRRGVVAFQRDLFEDVIPFVEANYRIRSEAAQRAIVGLSMGGGQSLTIGLNHPGRFAWVGGFSSAVFEPETALAAALADPKGTDSALRLVWIACGKDDSLVKNNTEIDALLKSRGIRHESYITEGNHSWPVWRGYLADFVPRLFVDKP